MPSFKDVGRSDASPNFSTNPVLERAQSQWLFTPEELLLAPSIVEGMPVAQELANRQKGVNFITQVGIMLKLPQLTLSTAAVYLHRFFMRHAMVQNNKPGLHHYSVAATALFLATKVEENYRKMKELVVACCRVAQKQPNLVVDEQSKEYWKWRDTILHNEDLLLEALCFDLQLEQPYRILYDFLRFYGVQENKALRNASWAFLNDSLVTTMCLQFAPRTIAGCALYLGVKLAGVSLPDDGRERPWWEQLGLDILDIQRGCNLMAEVYENPALPRQGHKDAYTKEDDLAMFDQTRMGTTPQPDRSPADSARSGSQGVKRDRDAVDERESSEWGSGAPVQRSPKRSRRESQDNEPGQSERSSQQQAPADGRSQKNDITTADDVQKRIDDIVNNSSQAPRQSHNNGQQERVPVARRPEKQSDRVSEQNNSRKSPGTTARVPSVPAAGRPAEVATQDAGNDLDDAEKVDYGSEEGEL
ncbi:Cyclin pch1 [Exophiala dermatitidis]